MYAIKSIATDSKKDKKGTVVKDKEGEVIRVPISCFLEGFRWPSEGVIVPDDFFADPSILARLVAFPAIEVSKSTDGETWDVVEPEDLDAGVGTSPSGVRIQSPGPSPGALAEARARGIHVEMPSDGPVRDASEKVRAHLQTMTDKKRHGRKRKVADTGV